MKFQDALTLLLLATVVVAKPLMASGLFSGAAMRDNASEGSASRQKPDSLNWIENNVVMMTPYSSECAAENTVVSVEALESAWIIATGRIIDFSYGAVSACMSIPSCSQGNPKTVYDYLLDQNAICLESDYPSGGNSFCALKTGLTCTYPRILKEYVTLNSSEVTMMEALQKQPLVVNFAFDNIGLYKGEMVTTSNCSLSPIPSYYGLLVGYGSDVNGSYWLVQPHKVDDSQKQIKIMKFERTNKADGPGVCGLGTIAMYPVVDDKMAPSVAPTPGRVDVVAVVFGVLVPTVVVVAIIFLVLYIHDRKKA